MSRPTTSQIIAKGDYLQPDFDPKSLTIAHLIGIFAYHNVQYPSQHNKAKLIAIFNNEIKGNSEVLRKQRLERQEALASEEGIVDGVTGIPIAPAEPAAPRRYSRRLSREPSAEPPPVLDPPKRRRSSAEPSASRTGSRKPIVKIEPLISEESEDENPVPIPEKRKEKESSRGRRISHKFGPGTDDSGWEDNNIFQSGAESSSPVRPPRNKVPGSGLRKSRAPSGSPPHSLPAPPIFPVNPKPILEQSTLSLPRPSRKSNIFAPEEDEYIDDVSGLADVSAEIVVEEDSVNEDEAIAAAELEAELEAEMKVELEEEFLPSRHSTPLRDNNAPSPPPELIEDKQTLEVAQRIADGGAPLARQDPQTSVPLWQKLLITTLFIALSGVASLYKLESAPIGFCDTGLQTNTALLEIREKRLEVEACYVKHGNNSVNVCPPLPLPIPHPDSCTPCPAHARCSQFSVTCDEGYVLRPHLFSYIPHLPEFANGLPGLGSVAFPPTCIDDVLRKKNVGTLGKRIDALLAETRGDRVCAGIDTRKTIDGGEARRWGYAFNDLKEIILKKFRGDDKSIANFETLLWEAITQLETYGRLIQEQDSQGRLFIASNHSAMNWSCRGIVAARQYWSESRKYVFSMISIFVMGFYLRFRRAANIEQKQKTAELVQIALEMLRNQEMAFHIDPVTTPHPYISPMQLRDHILESEHDERIRQRMWAPVERVVEGNANVRVNLEELRGGEETRVWNWVGTSGFASPVKKRPSTFESPYKEQYSSVIFEDVKERMST